MNPTNLKAAFCDRGILTKPSTIVLPSPPLVDSALKLKPESNSEEGFFVIIFKLPACDAAPYNVPCGPVNDSTLSIS